MQFQKVLNIGQEFYVRKEYSYLLSGVLNEIIIGIFMPRYSDGKFSDEIRITKNPAADLNPSLQVIQKEIFG